MVTLILPDNVGKEKLIILIEQLNVQLSLQFNTNEQHFITCFPDYYLKSCK